jgi:hypothetical protein
MVKKGLSSDVPPKPLQELALKFYLNITTFDEPCNAGRCTTGTEALNVRDAALTLQNRSRTVQFAHSELTNSETN